MNSETKENVKYLGLLYLLQPFAGLVVSIKYYRAPWAKNIVWLFIIYYGFTIAIGDPQMDANRIRDYLIIWHNTEMTFQNLTALYYSESSNMVDVVQPTLMFLVSRFTDNHRFIFGIYALILGYFYTRNIWYLIERAGEKIKQENILIIITFAFVIGFWSINGFRMWTAAHVFFYGAIRYLMEDSKKGLVIASTSLFFHFSFMLPVATLLLFTLIKSKIHLLYWFFIISFFMSEININIFRETLLTYLPSAFEQRITAYTNEGYAEVVAERSGQMNWYALMYRAFLHWVIILFLSIFYFKGLSFIRQNIPFKHLMAFSLFFLGVVNLVAHIPSIGRFYSVGHLFALASIFLYLQHAPHLNSEKWLRILSIPVLLLYCLMALRLSFDTISVMAVLGNPLVAIFTTIDTALIELIK